MVQLSTTTALSGAEAAHHGSVRIGVGVSTAREARQAAVGATADALDELAGEVPSLTVLLASRSHADEAGDLLDAVQEMIEPPALIGCVAQAIVAGRRELEDEAGVAVWLASGLPAETFQLDFVRTGSGGLLAGYQFDQSAHDPHLLLPDPYTFPSNLLIEHLNTDHVEVSTDFSDTEGAETFLHHRVLILPVLDGKRVAGVITRADFFRALADRFLAGGG